MTLYYIEKVGVYSHGVIGIYDTREDAMEAAEHHTRNPQPFGDTDGCQEDVSGDGDGYHSFHVIKTQLGGGMAKLVAVWKGRKCYKTLDGKFGCSSSYSWVIKEAP